MSWIVPVAVLCFLAGTGLANDNPKFSTEKNFFVTVGTPLVLKCEVDTGMDFLVDKQLRFVFVSAKTGLNHTVSEQGSLMDSYAQDGLYDLEFNYSPIVYAQLTINSVTDNLDGRFVCEVKPNGLTVSEFATTNITVAAGVESMEMIVGENMVTTQGSKPLSFREGMIEIVCKVSGTNPAPKIHLMLGGELLSGNQDILLDNDSPLPRRSYRGSVTYSLDFTTDMFNKRLTCHGETTVPEGVNIQLRDQTVGTVLKGIVDEPVVSCSNNTAGLKDKKIKLVCLVSKQPPIKSISFNVGNRYILYPGNQTESLIEVMEMDFNETFREATLKFHVMEDWHFKANIYLDIEALDGKTYQYPVFLMKDVSSSPALTSALTLPVLCLLAMVLNSLI